MPAISIVVPVYRSEEFLRDAIKSIQAQTFSDFELILVDDSSPDKSGQICDEAAKNDFRIKVLHMEKNRGICGARNAGLAAATGEYIAFCDDDDLYYPTLLEENYLLAQKYNADMVKFGRELIDILSDGQQRVGKTKINSLQIITNEELKNQYFKIRSLGIFINIWNGLYKRSIFVENNLSFDQNMKYGGEDAKLSLEYYMCISTLVVNPGIYYKHFRRNNHSTSRKYNANKIDSLVEIVKTDKRIWDTIDNIQDHHVDMISILNSCLINIITNQLFHKQCDLSFHEKIERIASLKKNPVFIYEFSRKIFMILLRQKPKQAFVSYLFCKRHYRALYILLKCYNLLFGEIW